MKKLGDFFREERENKNLLLRQAAAQLDIDQAVLSKIERSERKATKDQLDQFIELYKLSKKEILIKWNAERIMDLLEGEENLIEILKEIEAQYAE
ncbi:MAG: XRE family transcriptional regulator [Planctomycetes bacterium]|nr:XRE family transcriptional regulator [Planctomycetota bacterium]